MEKALYDPEEGYYSTRIDNIGLNQSADFFTSPSLSPIFGMTIARFIMHMYDMLEDSSLVFLEVGAGDGTTAGQIIGYLKKHRPAMLKRFSYLALEHYGARLSRLRGNISHLSNVMVVSDIEAIEPITGIIFSNEFFDALPVHRVVQVGKALKEIYLCTEGSTFHETVLELSDEGLKEFLVKEEIELHDGQIADISLEWGRWVKKLAGKLKKGCMITIDYGYPAYELYSPIRKNGSLRAYRHHQISNNYYDEPAEQDLTSHVDFTALAKAGEEAGLVTIGLSDQLRMFLALGVHEILEELEKESENFTQYQLAVQPAKALFMPGGIGEIFKVLAQSRNLDFSVVNKLRSLIPPKYKLYNTT